MTVGTRQDSPSRVGRDRRAEAAQGIRSIVDRYPRLDDGRPASAPPDRLPRDRRAARRRGAPAARHGPPVRRRPDPARRGRLVRGGHLPEGHGQGDGRARAARHAPRGLRVRRHQRGGLRPGLPRARGRRLRGPQLRVGAGLAGHVPDLEVRLRGAEAGVAAPHGGRRGHRLLRPDRARPRQRPGSMRTSARRDGDDWVLNGTKMWITNGVVADVAVVWAAAPTRGIHGFIVPTDTPGFVGQRHPPASSRCGPRSPPSWCSTTSACPRRAAARGRRPAGPAVVPQRGALRHRLGRDWARRGPATRRRSPTQGRACSSASPIAGVPAHPAQARRDDGAGAEGAAARAAPRAHEGRRAAAPGPGQLRQDGQRPRGARDRPRGPVGARRQRHHASSTR